MIVHCKLTQVHMPRGSTSTIESDTVFGVICQLPLLREEFGRATLTFHSDLRRRAASRRALACPSSSFIHSFIHSFKMRHADIKCTLQQDGAPPQKQCAISVTRKCQLHRAEHVATKQLGSKYGGPCCLASAAASRKRFITADCKSFKSVQELCDECHKSAPTPPPFIFLLN